MTVEPSEPRRDAVLRISDIDRGTALTRLQQAQLEGRLTGEEFEARATLLRDAKTQAELRTLLADLPGRHQIPVEETVELRTATGSIKRNGLWTVPRKLIIHSGTGSVKLDFTEALISDDEIQIELRVGTGSTLIILPPGASANVNHFHGGTGTVSSKVPDHPIGDAPHFRINGKAGTGSVKVKYRRRRLFQR